MVILGIIVAAAAVGIGIAIVVDNTTTASLSMFGNHIPGVSSTGQIFIGGVLVTMLFVIGLLIATLAMGRSMRVRRELRDLREEREESLSTLERENQQLQHELARARGRTNATRPEGPVAGRRTDALPARRRDPVSPFFDQNA